MILVEKVLGNSGDPEWKAKLAGAAVDVLELSRWDAQKNRLRKESKNGVSVAISLERNALLHDGDVLLWDEAARAALICTIDLCDVMIIDLRGLEKLPPEQITERAVRLGHALGNQHWPLVAKDHLVYVPVTVDRKVADSVMNTHRFEGVSHSFAPGGDIVGRLAPAEARRLFGGGENPAHLHHASAAPAGRRDEFAEPDHAQKTGTSYA